jgi:hypothetical protein
MAAARDLVGEAEFAEAYQRGARLTLEAALDEALAAVD